MQNPRLAFLLLAIAVPGLAQSNDVAQIEGSLGAASFSGGYILGWDSPMYRMMTVYGPEAKPVYSRPIFIKHEGDYPVWAVDSDGEVARISEMVGVVKQNRIDFLDATGTVVQSINTGFFAAQHLTFAPDHTLWAVGYEDQYEKRDVDFNVVHHYARTGEDLGGMLPWSKIAGDLNGYTSLQLCLGGRYLFATKDHLAFKAFLQHGHDTWIEISTGGALMGRYELGDFDVLYYVPRAVTESGHVYALVYEDRHPAGYAVLNRSKGTWSKVHGCPRHSALIGADRESLIFSQHDGGWTRIIQVPTSELHVDPK